MTAKADGTYNCHWAMKG